MTWNVRCYTCAYARGFGAAKINADLAADKHGRRYPHHLVATLNTTIKSLRICDAPTLFSELPPF